MGPGEYAMKLQQPEFGEFLRARRRSLGLSMETIAAETGMFKQTISLIELGEQQVSTKRIDRILAAYLLTVEILPNEQL